MRYMAAADYDDEECEEERCFNDDDDDDYMDACVMKEEAAPK
jgi:hypothetical protein